MKSLQTRHVSLVGHGEDLQAILDDLPEGMTVDVKRLGDHGRFVDCPAILTDRQREAVATAWVVGYYDVPREAGIEAVADGQDCANSTASDLLRRAEARLVGAALGKR